MKKTLILTAIIVLSCLAATGCGKPCTRPGGTHTWNPWEDRLREDGTARENVFALILQERHCLSCNIVERGFH